MKQIFHLGIVWLALTQTASAQWQLNETEKREIAARPKMTQAQGREEMAMVAEVNHLMIAYRAAVIQKMLAEANYFADRLRLPTPRPIRLADIRDAWVAHPWFGIIDEHYPPYLGYLPKTVFSTNIYNGNIPRETRLRALKFGVEGWIETTNFQFSFYQGSLRDVMRLDAPNMERYAQRLDQLVGKPSLIDTNGAYQLATQWLAAVDVNVTALEKQYPPSVNQLSYLPRGASNAVILPLYYVDFGLRPIHRESPVEVEILGTTKELQELSVANGYVGSDVPYDHRPLLIITNALDLVRTPNPPLKRLQRSQSIQTNSPSP